MKRWISLWLALLLTTPIWSQERLLEEYLESGRISEGHRAVEQALQKSPGQHDLQLQLALAQLLLGLEKFSQDLYRLGLRDSWFSRSVPFLRLPVELNPQPQVARYAEVRQALLDFSKALDQTAAILAEIPDTSQVRLPLRLGRVRLDLNGDGQASTREELWRVLERLNPGTGLSEKTARRFGLHLDVGDVRWLEGYCHLLSGLAQTALAYDGAQLFEHTGHLFFLKAQTSYAFLSPASWEDELLDLVAFLHLLSFPLQEGERLQGALLHFRKVIQLSRRSWACIQAEVDNHYEWIPNPHQKSVIPDWKVTASMLKQWSKFLDESEDILEGRKLVPFWRRLPEGQGLNLNKVFTQPRPFDAILWLQGPGAAPYLESGTLTSPEFWRQLQRTFGGQFWGFAAWFN